MWNTNRNESESHKVLTNLASFIEKRAGINLPKDIKTLCSMEVDYLLPLHVIEAIRQVQALFQKNMGLDLGVDKADVALQAFYKSEDLCAESNVRLSQPCTTNCAFDAIMLMARNEIGKILDGRLPSDESGVMDMKTIFDSLELAFGPGANINIKADKANALCKSGAPLTCSYNFVNLVPTLVASAPGLLGEVDGPCSILCEPVHGKLTTVPKSWKTDRTIMIEPMLNTLVQKGIGTLIRNALGDRGINLRDQNRNKKLAQMGSIDGSNATLDLSSASDCVSIELVRQLLPVDWFDLLMSVRTPTVLVNTVGREQPTLIRLQKMSSMGNGFTFELESLIFFALAVSTTRYLDLPTSNVSVYGDDIIVPVNAAPLLMEILNLAGFIINTDKSFWTGNFRESCGGDYVLGHDVRPFYVRDNISDMILYSFHNFCIRTGDMELAAFVKSFITGDCLYGPDGYGDGHLLGSWDPVPMTRKELRSGYGGCTFLSYKLEKRHYYPRGCSLVRNFKPCEGTVDVSRRVVLTYNLRLLPAYMICRKQIVDDIGEDNTSIVSPLLYEDMLLDPFVIRGSSGVVVTRVYTFATGIFL